ncbi:uncharacterized protein LOC120335529 [Styela clava]
MKKNVPKIRQGVLETSQKGNKPLTSTLKSSKTNKQKERPKPLVVCHNPGVVHSYLKSGENCGELVEDTVPSPRAVVIPAAAAGNITQDNSMLQKSIMKSSSRKFVKSRYKQAAANIVVAGSISKNNSSTASRSKSRSIEKSKEDTFTNYSLKTPKPNLGPGITSTPSYEHPPRPVLDWNASTIERSRNSNYSPAETTRMRKVGEYFDDSEIDDEEILYCRYLQWHYLGLTKEEEMQQKHQQATSELTFLHNKNAELAEEVEQLNEEISKLEHHCELEKHLDIQQAGLAPVVDKLPSILGPYKTLADNLDTTCHNFPLTGAYIPDEDDLECTLDETRNLLGQINILTHSQAPVMEEMSQKTQALGENCQRNAETVVAAKNELAQETSAALEKASLISQLYWFQGYCS